MAISLLAPGVFASVSAIPDGESSLTVTITPKGYRISDTSADGRSWREVRGLTGGGTSIPGRPELPLEGYWIALPEGARAKVTILDVEYDDLPGAPVRPVPREAPVANGTVPGFVPYVDESFYRASSWYPSRIAALGAPGRFRHQAMTPLRIAPFQVNPATGVLRAYRSIEVRIDFTSPSMMKGLSRESVGDEGRWEGIYQGALLNYGQGKRFRSRPARPMAGVPKRAATKDEYKLFVEKGGLYRITFDDLASAGLADNEPVSSIALYRRGFSDSLLEALGDPFTEINIPIDVIDADGNGLFNGGDEIRAWLPGFREDRMERDDDDRFAYEAVYFLSFEGVRNPLETRPPWSDLPGATNLVSFPDSIRWEIDAIYNWNTPIDTVDNYYGMGDLNNNRLTEIILPVPDTSALFGIKAMTVSTQLVNGESAYHRYRLVSEANGDTVFNERVDGEIGMLFRSDRVFSAADLVEGVNRFRYFGSRSTDSTEEITGAGGFLDWYEIHGDFLYRAVDDYLIFSTGERSGAVRMELERFSDPDVIILDVTDIYAPVRLSADSVVQSGNTYSVVLRDSTASPRRYVAATASGARTLPSSKIVRDAPTDLAGAPGDYLIITYDDFYDALDDFVDYRRSTGYRVVRARISDVYDEFNGGIKDPVAIQNYIRYGFERWDTPPGWVLLVGDGFEDYKGIATNRGGSNNNASDFDYVPSYPGYAATIYGSGDHWDASDLWYGFLDGDSDALLDVIVGRFTADNPEDVETMADKTIAYERFTGSDAWRNRVMFVADDAWTFESMCMRNVYQNQFEDNTRFFSEEVKASAARGIDTVNIFLSRFTDGYHELYPCPTPDSRFPDSIQADVDEVIDHSRDAITSTLFNEWNGEGVFLVNFQGHGNRNVLTHEVILRNSADYRNRRSDDIDSLTDNEGKPYIFMAYGCSISEFDRWKSQGSEAITEEMMASRKGGAVATFGSTGIEFLRPNLKLNNSILKYFFQTPGVIPAAAGDERPVWYKGVPRWSLGEVLALGLVDFVAVEKEKPSVIRRYALFGDPALVLDAGVPTFEVFVDGVPVEDGSVLRGHADGSPVTIEAFLHDETVLDTDSITVRDRDGLVDSTLYALEKDTSLADDGRAWILRYETTVNTIASYDVVFRAVDYNGRPGTFTLKVSIGVNVTFDGRSIAPGELVSPAPEIRAEIETPLPVDEEDVFFRIDGVGVALDTLRKVDANNWIATARPRLSGGDHELVIGINAQTKSFTFRVDDKFRIVNLLNYPNPAEETTGFYYDLTDFADRVEVEVFTVGGRRIRHLRGLSARAGYNANPDAWDGLDDDGDRVAYGVYLYRLRAWRGDERAESIGKAVFVPPDLPGSSQQVEGAR